MELYRSRLHEMHQELGEYSERDAAADFARYLHGQSTDNMLELRYPDRRRVHNLKYYTWVEQQGRTYAEIQQQWYEPNYWTDVQTQADEIDELIVEFMVATRRPTRPTQTKGRVSPSTPRTSSTRRSIQTCSTR